MGQVPSEDRHLPPTLFLRFHEVAFQRLHVVLEGFAALGSGAAEGAGAFALEALVNGDVARRGEFFDLHAEVACRGARLLLDVWELRLLHTYEQRDHRKPQLRVQQWV